MLHRHGFWPLETLICPFPPSPLPRHLCAQLSGFEGWLRTQEVLSDAGGYGAAEYSAMESPRPRMQYTSLHPQQQHQQHAYTPYGYPTSTLASPPGTATVTSPPRGGGGGGGAPGAAWGAPSAAAGGPGPSPGFATGSFAGGSLGRASPMRSPGLGLGLGLAGGAGLTQAWGPGGAGATGGAGGVAASLRETFLAATAPQRPAAHVAPYGLPSTVGGWVGGRGAW